MKLRFLVLASFYCQLAIAQASGWARFEVYGNRQIKTAVIFDALGVKQGDSIKMDKFKKGDMIAKLKQVPGIKYASINEVCCNAQGGSTLYTAVGESDSVILKHRIAPNQNIQLPDSIFQTYKNFMDKLGEGVRKSENREDDSNGYAMFNYPPAQNEQRKLISYAGTNLQTLVRVLQNSKYESQRAAAATMIAYVPEKKKIINYLLYAADDADAEVRNNATRALGILADYNQSHNELKLNIPAGPFIKMMNSFVWTDRNKGANVVMKLCQSGNQALLQEIKEQALPSLIEMAKWKDNGHAAFSFIILGLIAGIDPATLATKSFSNDREQEVDLMVEKIRLQK